MIQARPIFDRLTALADPTRSRLLLLLDRHELTVGELCAALQLPQSTVSRHLKTLADELPVIREHGYEIARVRPVDMFPHTTHIETVVELRRVSKVSRVPKVPRVRRA